MITDDELDALADAVGCRVSYLGNELWECYHKDEDYCSYGDYAQIYQLLEELRFERLRIDTRAVASEPLPRLP